MQYDNSTIRRHDRLLAEDQAVALLRSSEWGVLSMVDVDGNPYGIPINYVWDGLSSAYVHCAPVGHKLTALAACPQVTLTIVGGVNLKPESFTTEYQSIILRGTAHLGLSDDEKRHGLELLVDKLSPEHRPLGLKYIEKSFHRVDVIRLDFTTWSGKAKQVPTTITY